MNTLHTFLAFTLSAGKWQSARIRREEKRQKRKKKTNIITLLRPHFFFCIIIKYTKPREVNEE